jgi:hypothetical protein
MKQNNDFKMEKKKDYVSAARLAALRRISSPMREKTLVFSWVCGINTSVMDSHTLDDAWLATS